MKSLRIILLFLTSGTALMAQNNMYTGKYTVENAPFTTILIYEENGKLTGEAVGQGKSELSLSDSKDLFDVMEVPGASVEFSRENGLVNALKLTMNGDVFAGKRVFPDLNEYNGTYEFTDAPVSKVTVKAQNGLLHISTAEFGETDLEFRGVIDEYYESNYGGRFVFNRNESNDVVKLIIEVSSQGLKMEGTKQAGTPDLTGKYEIKEYGVLLTIGMKEQRLFVSSDQGDSFLKAHEKPNTFDTENGEARLEFVLDAGGLVEKVNVTYQGQPFTAFPVK